MLTMGGSASPVSRLESRMRPARFLSPRLLTGLLALALTASAVVLVAEPVAAKHPRLPHHYGATIEPLAGYEPQRRCSPQAKPGTTAFANLLLRTYRSTRSLGISRACSVGGTSEHKEGRAFDWAVSANSAADRRRVQNLMRWLLQTDRHGNAFAMARRIGIQYMIWNRRIWGAYSADSGWRPYTGSNPHTDHVHFSFSWRGARKNSSFWQGEGRNGRPSLSAADGTRSVRAHPSSDTYDLHDSPDLHDSHGSDIAPTRVPDGVLLDSRTVAQRLGGTWTAGDRRAVGCPTAAHVDASVVHRTSVVAEGGSSVRQTVAAFASAAAADRAVDDARDRLVGCGWSVLDPRVGSAAVQGVAPDGTQRVLVAATEGVTVTLVGSGGRPADRREWAGLADLALGSACGASAHGCH